MAKLFGTDGIRGEANRDLTPRLALGMARAGGFFLGKETGSPRVVVGKDTRISGDMLEGAIVAGLASLGLDVYLAGVITTPGVAFLTRDLEARGGIMVSASHNPVEDNGIKFFDSRGLKLSDWQEEEIEALYFEEEDRLPCPPGGETGRVIPLEGGVRRYQEFLKRTVPADPRGLKVVLDCAHGAASPVAPGLFQELGMEVKAINHAPDGRNINVSCGSTHPGVVREAVLSTGAGAGFAFDGDGDRLIAVDEKGGLVDGDQVMLVCGRYLKDKGRLKGNTLVATVMSNLGFELAAREMGIRVERTRVGDRYVLETMVQQGYNLGGEQSGHIIFLDYNTTGDGILSALQLAGIMAETGQPLSALAGIMEKAPQVLINARVKSAAGLWERERIREAVTRAEEELGDKGRILVRPSGTEPLVRVMVEGQEEGSLHIMANKIVKILEEELG